MERSQFTSSSPGRLSPVQVPAPGKDWTFTPHSLPPQWNFPVRLWPLLAAAKEALGTLNGIGQLLPDPQLLLRPLQSREAIASSGIEGTYVTPEQLLLFELDPQEVELSDHEAADRQEVYNYGLALLRGCELLETLPLCNRVICDMHRVLMTGARGQNKNPGSFRTYQVQIGSNGRFMPPPASEVDRLMGDLECYVNTENEEFDPLVRCFMVHYQFEAIHPFGDGNGRVGRALLALMVYKLLGHVKPWLYISAYFEQYRDEYMKCLFDVSTTGDWEGWIEFCLRGAAEQANDSIRRCHLFNALRKEFHERVASSTTRTYAIIESLFKTPAVTITSVSKQFGTAYHTAQADIERLIRANVLREMEGKYPRTFFAPEIIRVAYGVNSSLHES